MHSHSFIFSHSIVYATFLHFVNVVDLRMVILLFGKQYASTRSSGRKERSEIKSVQYTISSQKQFKYKVGISYNILSTTRNATKLTLSKSKTNLFREEQINNPCNCHTFKLSLPDRFLLDFFPIPQ
jgi:hypothetical protein